MPCFWYEFNILWKPEFNSSCEFSKPVWDISARQLTCVLCLAASHKQTASMSHRTVELDVFITEYCVAYWSELYYYTSDRRRKSLWSIFGQELFKLIYQIRNTSVKGSILFFNSQDPQGSLCLQSEMTNMDDDPHLGYLNFFFINLIVGWKYGYTPKINLLGCLEVP